MNKVAGFAGPRVAAIAGSFCTRAARDDDAASRRNLEAADLCIAPHN